MFKNIYLLFIFIITILLIPLGVFAVDQIVVGTNAEFAPFTYIENNEVVGFDIDIAREVCKRINKEIVIKDMPFDALIPDLVLGNVHFVAAGMTRTDERAKRVLFTKPYITGDPLVIVTYNSMPYSFEQLTGKTVIVNEGYTADLFLTGKDDIQLVRLNSPADAFLALKSKRADAFVTAKTTFDAFRKNSAAGEYNCSAIDATEENCALAISKKYPHLQIVIQEALDNMEKDGTIEQLKKKWHLV